MQIQNIGAVVTGGASGLGKATAQRLIALGARVTIADLPSSDGAAVAEQLGHGTRFVAADVTDEEQMKTVFSAAAAQAPLRVTVHCAGRGAPLRILDKTAETGSLQPYPGVINTTLLGDLITPRPSPGSTSVEERGWRALEIA